MYSARYLSSYSRTRLDKKRTCKRGKPCGDVCIPKKHNCRTGASSQASGGEVKKLAEAEDKIRNLPYEEAYFIDPNTGKQLLHKKGAESSVSFTSEEMATAKGAIVTHNHPNLGNYPDSDPRSKGISFSPADIQFANVTQAAEIRAVSRGYNHSLKPPDGGWNEEFWHRKVRPAHERYQREVLNEMQWKIIFGRTSVAQADADYWHEVSRRTAAATGMKYSRTPVGG